MEAKESIATHGVEKDENERANMSAGASNTGTEKPTCVIVLGMAGSGKTTFVQVKKMIDIFVYISCRSSDM
jgi:polynucleotide 5'-kinase involved in rRNA processing